MLLQVYIGILFAIALNDVVIRETSGIKFGSLRFGKHADFDDNYEEVHSKTYNIFTTITNKKGKCTKHVTVTGYGVGDTLFLTCSPNGVVTITSKKVMIYGNPPTDSFSVFSDQPSTLFVYKDNACKKRKYKTVSRKTILDEELELSELECTKLQSKINNILEQELSYLDFLDANDDKKQTPTTQNVQTLPQTPVTSVNKPEDSQKATPTSSEQEGTDAHQTFNTASDTQKKDEKPTTTLGSSTNVNGNEAFQPPTNTDLQRTTSYNSPKFNDFVRRRSSFKY